MRERRSQTTAAKVNKTLLSLTSDDLRKRLIFYVQTVMKSQLAGDRRRSVFGLKAVTKPTKQQRLVDDVIKP